jgi:aminobenzoyl-glutamate utilization protein A
MTDTMRFVEERLGEWLAFRRDLHKHPELGFMECRTQATLADRLLTLGYDVRTGEEVMRREAMLGRPSPPALAAARDYAVAHGARSDLVERMTDCMSYGMS